MWQRPVLLRLITGSGVLGFWGFWGFGVMGFRGFGAVGLWVLRFRVLGFRV